MLFKCGFYSQVSNNIIWSIGLLGFCFNLYVLGSKIETGDVVGKTLVGFTFLQLAPLILFFPVLYKKNSIRVVQYNSKCIFYLILLIVVAFATNSREAILEPIGTFALLFLLSYINCEKKIRQTINKKHIVIGILLITFVLPIINDISLAMLYNRTFRNDISRSELFSKTMDTFLDKDKMETLYLLKEKREEKETIISVKNTKNGLRYM